eukprot:9498058-Pyramimonas_sp.AAC.1
MAPDDALTVGTCPSLLERGRRAACPGIPPRMHGSYFASISGPHGFEWGMGNGKTYVSLGTRHWLGAMGGPLGWAARGLESADRSIRRGRKPNGGSRLKCPGGVLEVSGKKSSRTPAPKYRWAVTAAPQTGPSARRQRSLLAAARSAARGRALWLKGIKLPSGAAPPRLKPRAPVPPR